MPAGRAKEANGSRQRLASISHFFLSEPETILPAPTGIVLLPVLLDSVKDDHLIYALAQSFHARNLKTSVLHVDPALQKRDNRSSPLYTFPGTPTEIQALLNDLCGVKQLPDLCMLPHTEFEGHSLRLYDRVIIAVPAGDMAMRRIYLRIKRLVIQSGPLAIGAAMMNFADDQAAGAHFDMLAGGIRQFLGRQLYYLGCMRELRKSSANLCGQAHMANGRPSPGDAAEVAECVLDNWFRLPPTRVHRARRRAHTDPAG